jgi:hypothetical protein
MKYLNIKIPIYDWNLYFIEVEDKADLVKVLAKFNIIKPTKELVDEVISNIDRGMFNGGMHYYNTDMRKTLIMLYKTTSKAKRINIIFHEQRHAVDRICAHLLIDDIEASAHLSGFIAEKLTPIL